MINRKINATGTELPDLRGWDCIMQLIHIDRLWHNESRQFRNPNIKNRTVIYHKDTFLYEKQHKQCKKMRGTTTQPKKNKNLSRLVLVLAVSNTEMHTSRQILSSAQRMISTHRSRIKDQLDIQVSICYIFITHNSWISEWNCERIISRSQFMCYFSGWKKIKSL